VENGPGKALAAGPGTIQTQPDAQGEKGESLPANATSPAPQGTPESMPARDTGEGNAPAPPQETLVQPELEDEPGRQNATQATTHAPPAQAGTKPWRTPSAQPAKEPARSPGQGAGKNAETIRLFQSAAFRGNFEALPKWKRVLSKAREQVRVLGGCTGASCPPGATSWQRIMQQARGQEPMEQLKMVTAFFNKWPYRLDMDAFGTSDWWATPQEFLKLSGDCEDYAITKYFALRELGFSQDDLRIVIVRDRIRGIGHAVLAVFLHGEAFVLDNLTSSVFAHSKYMHYTPQYSLNEEYRWSHIPLAKQP
jgi:predicted transglutaminase-like cysteine proteinase